MDKGCVKPKLPIYLKCVFSTIDNILIVQYSSAEMI